MKRRYVCNKYKSYSIRNHYFVNGLFETDDPGVQDLIEHADGYGVFIHPVETCEEIAAMRAAERGARRASSRALLDSVGESGPLAHQGARGTGVSKSERGLMLVKAVK